MRTRTPLTFPVAGILTVLFMALVAIPGASAQRSSSGPVAVVDLAGVMSGLAERADAEAQLRAKEEQYLTEVQQKEADVRALEAAFAGLSDPAERIAAEERLDAATVQFMAWNELWKRQMDLEQALLLEKLYKDVMAAIAEMAQADGIDLVLIHDGLSDIQAEFSPNAPPLATQIRNQIAVRRVAYAAPQIDRTHDVIIRMNNAYGATDR